MASDEKTVQLIDVGASIRTRYLEQAKKCQSWFIFEALKVLNDAEANYRTSQNKRLAVEFALMRLCNIEYEKKNEI